MAAQSAMDEGIRREPVIPLDRDGVIVHSVGDAVVRERRRRPETDAERIRLLRDRLYRLIDEIHAVGAGRFGIRVIEATERARQALVFTEPEPSPSLREVAQDIVESIARVQERPTNYVHQFVPRCELQRWRENLERALATER